MVHERRRDGRTSINISEALRARGILPSAQAMEHMRVRFETARRVLTGPKRRRSR